MVTHVHAPLKDRLKPSNLSPTVKEIDMEICIILLGAITRVSDDYVSVPEVPSDMYPIGYPDLAGKLSTSDDSSDSEFDLE